MTVLVEEVEIVALVLLATVAARLIVIVHVQAYVRACLQAVPGMKETRRMIGRSEV